MNIIKKRTGLLIFSTLVLAVSGIIYAWANLSAPLYDFGWGEAALTLNYTLTFFFFAIGQLGAGVISKKVSPKWLLIISAILIVASFWITSTLTRDSDILLLYFAYGGLGGLAIGGIYNTVISVTCLWFPDKKGFCSGILLTGYGLGSFAISLISGNLMASGIIGWRTLYRALSLLTGVFTVAGAFAVKAPPENAVFPAPKNKNTVTDVHSFTGKETLKTSAFWILWLSTPLLAGIGNSVVGCSKTLITQTTVSRSAAILIASLVSIMNSLGRPLAGILIDRLGIKKTRVFAGICAIIGCCVALFGTRSGSAALVTAGLFLTGFTYGFNAAIASTLSFEYFGPKYNSMNLGLINSNSMLIAVFPSLFTAIALSFSSYIPAYAFLMVSGVVAIVATFFLKRPVYKVVNAE